MCFGFFFFNLLLTYFVLLVTFTYVRRFVSYKGVFYTFAGFLSIFVGYLVNNFDSFILFFAVEDFVLSLNTVNWLALDISISLRCDALSFLFVLLVAAIGLATNLYVLNYFKYEANEDVFALLIN
jgi:formate hydrogenlyase subunit 3/multisubunit Na+/H+ antiporter MnhD subunit